MAKNVSVTWLQKKQFVGIGSSQRSVVMSGQDEENAIGVSPSEMMLLGLAGCSAYDVVGILENKKATLTGLEVKVSGEPLLMSRREYMLLKALMESPNKVQTRDMLDSKLYGWGEEVSSNAVEVHIHNLRKKLPEGFIRTVRGVGYVVKSAI